MKRTLDEEDEGTALSQRGGDGAWAGRWRTERDIEIEGTWPPPVVAFEELLLPSSLLAHLRSSYTKPTDVQAQVIPAALAGADLLISAPTGSGKTLAFGVPLIAMHRQSTCASACTNT